MLREKIAINASWEFATMVVLAKTNISTTGEKPLNDEVDFAYYGKGKAKMGKEPRPKNLEYRPRTIAPVSSSRPSIFDLLGDRIAWLVPWAERFEQGRTGRTG